MTESHRRRALGFLPAAAVLGISGCAMERSGLNPAGPAARDLFRLGAPILFGFVVVSLVMWGLLVWVAMRRTGNLEEHAPATAAGGESWIAVGGFAIPALAFAAVFVATLRTMAAFPMHAPVHEGDHPDILVTGRQWWWEVQYRIGPEDGWIRTANEIHIPAGRPVEIGLQSTDVIHSFWVPRLHGKVDLVPGFTNTIRVQADRPGIFPGECAEFCGMEHARMRFVVVAENPAKFDAWMAHERAPALEGGTPPATRGATVFQGAACPVCHTVRGTPAEGTVGPELTHLASRLTIGAGTFPLDVAILHGWVSDAPSLKPGTRMPRLTQFSGEELGDLVAYLQSLR
ncbi:MAG TPA: cytochrome c oxidase subunit II [Thermoanaerobaculia bacterium]|nr:cytochrome c oxidase subunit II [Thermoanaerobaculia bacterium]